MSVTKTAAVAYFLNANTHPDLAALYSKEMELQVLVAQDGGNKIDGEFRGRQWAAWTDGLSQWKSFRIPLNANSDPTDNDGPQLFNLGAHVEGIGLTGWDWKNRVSKWVGFDFDSIAGHAEGHRGKLTDEEMAEVKRKAMAITWITVRKSTGGNGIHLYVFLPDVPTVNHTEHAALARSVLGQMSAAAGFDFKAKVDVCGSVLWQYHRKMKGTDGLTLLKQGETLKDIPPDWRDHVSVVTGQRRRTIPQVLAAEDNRSQRDRLFDEMTGQQQNVPLDADHKKLQDWLTEQGAPWSWSQDHHSMTTHTFWLKQAHTALGLKGPFETVSTGRNRGIDINCFAFPLRDGGWVVRRHGNNTAEAITWSKDRSGYTKCFLNREPSLSDVAKSTGATEIESGGFAYPKASEAVVAAAALGAEVTLPEWANSRGAKLKSHKDGRLIVKVEGSASDSAHEMVGWNKEKGAWHRIFDVQTAPADSQEDTGNFDSMIRHLVTERGEDAGWVVFADRIWRKESKDNAKDSLVHLGVKKGDVAGVMGSCVMKPWTLVKIPFGDEYLGDRLWNRNAPRLRYAASTDLDRLHYPTWIRILTHIGQGMNDAVKCNAWCRSNGIDTGADYLKVWIASLFQFPLKPLPYLFLYSKAQNTGKSILAEALERVIVDGVVRAKQALTSQGGFNGELESKVLCTVEEGDLKNVKGAYEKIKEWVNSPTIQIHPKGVTPYQVANTTHWIQTSNDSQGCPIDPNDTRITMIEVSPLDPTEIVPKDEMFLRLDKEAPDFLASVLGLEIPPTKDRLNVPVVETEEKAAAQKRSMSYLEVFLESNAHRVDGATIKVSEFYAKFLDWVDNGAKMEWSRKKVSSEMPQEYPKGRRRGDGEWCWGNLSWTKSKSKLPRLVCRGESLKPIDEVLLEEAR